MQRFLTITILLFLLTIVGTVGLRVIEGASWLDCLYMSVITLSTVGYGETVPLSSMGKIFIIVYLMMGLGIFTFTISTLGQWIVSMELQAVLERRRMQREIDKLSKHYIVCGLGRMGTTICSLLAERKKPFVVIDRDEEILLESRRQDGWLTVTGDATNDEVLKSAGIERAAALSSVLPTDADNVYVVLSARMLNTDLKIVARASEEKSIEKFERAGATRVVSPFSSGATRMARFMLNPSIEDFLEIASGGGGLQLAEVTITEDSPYIGKELRETDLSERGVMVIGISRADGSREMPPSRHHQILPGDKLFVFGSTEGVNEMLGELES